MIDPNFTAAQGAEVDRLVREIERLQAALKLARRVMQDFGLWKPGTPDTDQIRAALKP